MKVWTALLAAGLCAGCGVPLETPLENAVTNVCTSDKDCTEGSSCTPSGQCAATSYDIRGALLEVRPNGAAVFGGGMSFLVDPAAQGIALLSGADATPFFNAFEINLQPPIALEGSVLPDASTVIPAGCVLPKGTLPASLTFYRLPRLGSLPFDPVKTTTTGGANGAPYVFDIQLVSDTEDRYDVYIEPAQVPACPTFPPYFLPDQVIDANSTWTLPPIGTLTGTLTGLTDLDTWEVTVVEPTRGLAISTTSSLMLAVGTVGAAVSAPISPLPALPLPADASPILRLTPIAPTQADAMATDPTRPTVFWTLQGAISGGTKANPEVHFELDDLVTAPVTVTGQILGSDGLSHIPSQLTIQSQTLNGVDAGNAAYSNDTVLTDQSGVFTVGLPPGDYWIRAVPLTDNGLAITDIPLVWPLNMSSTACVCGVTFKMNGKALLEGSVSTAGGQLLSATTVGVSPSQTPARSYLANTHSLPPLPSRAETTTTDGAGQFSFLVDRGASDLTVQPDPSTNLPWLVVPQITPTSGMPPEPLTLKSPAFLGGTVRDPEGMPVANAEIDVWFPVRDPTNAAVLTGAVVKIATTQTDADGNYTLVLPSSI